MRKHGRQSKSKSFPRRGVELGAVLQGQLCGLQLYHNLATPLIVLKMKQESDEIESSNI